MSNSKRIVKSYRVWHQMDLFDSMIIMYEWYETNFEYRTRAINHRGYYSKNIFWAVGRGYNSRAATIQKIFFSHFLPLQKS